MDNIPSPPPTTTTTTTPDPDPHTRPEPTTTTKPLPPPFTNGVLKRIKPYNHHPHHHHHTNPPPVVVNYKECLKNHAAAMGGHAVDGCGEFMPSPASTPADPTSLKCAACGCHRNFHRRDPDGPFLANPILQQQQQQHVIEYQPHHRHHPPPPPPPAANPISLAGARESSLSPAESPSPPPISSSYYPISSAPHMLLALSSGLQAPPSENMNAQFSAVPISGIASNSSGKKRFRTKFTQEQKEKMHELAERVGWKMQKKDEDLILGFCNEIGVDKGVFKVWMHNNKMTFGKKDSDNTLVGNGSSGGGGGGIDFFAGRNDNRNDNNQLNNNDSGSSGGGNATGTNGSSSSS